MDAFQLSKSKDITIPLSKHAGRIIFVDIQRAPSPHDLFPTSGPPAVFSLLVKAPNGSDSAPEFRHLKPQSTPIRSRAQPLSALSTATFGSTFAGFAGWSFGKAMSSRTAATNTGFTIGR